MTREELIAAAKRKQLIEAAKYKFASTSNVAEPSLPTEEKISDTEAIARGVGQGFFGIGDEAIAALKSMTSGGKYEELVSRERELNKLAQKQSPYLYGGGMYGTNIATTFIPGLNIGKAATLGKAALQSGAMSALSAAGESEGSATDRLKSALVGGGLGLGTGAAGYKVAEGLSKIAPKLAEVATGATGREQQRKFKLGSGEELLKKGIVKFGSTPKSIADRSAKALAESSDEIGSSLSKIDKISKDQIMANLFTERAKLSGNEGNRLAIQKLDKEIEAFAKSPQARDASDVWNVKKTFESKVNWLSKKEKPNTAQANEKVAAALRNAVADVAEKQSPELAEKFAKDRATYSLLKPIKEASEREAATLQQRKIGGALDTLAAITGASYGGLTEGPQGAAKYGLGAAMLRRALVPRIPSMLAVTANQPIIQQGLQRAISTSPQATVASSYLGLLNGEYK